MSETSQRISEIGEALQVMRPAWRHMQIELGERIRALTVQLVSQDSEQVRGRIKALQDILELPETLQQERDGLSAALSEQDAAE